MKTSRAIFKLTHVAVGRPQVFTIGASLQAARVSWKCGRWLSPKWAIRGRKGRRWMERGKEGRNWRMRGVGKERVCKRAPKMEATVFFNLHVSLYLHVFYKLYLHLTCIYHWSHIPLATQTNYRKLRRCQPRTNGYQNVVHVGEAAMFAVQDVQDESRKMIC